MPGFLENWVEDKARNRIVREIGPLQSEWPAHTGSAVASGYLASLELGSCACLLSVPSSRWFKLRTLWITNNNAVMNKILLYTGGSNVGDVSGSLGEIWVGPRTTEFIAIDGITFGGDLHASCLVESIGIRVAGILLSSGPEN